ncbi:MAG: hypothetical protein Q8O88_04190 [bacterium]|nr:hypothetical protein [bacterium]
MSEESAKKDFISTWFDIEKKRFTLIQRLELLKRWTKTCVSFEEYEMAAVLRKERNKTIRQYRKEMSGKRSIFRSIKIIVDYTLRKAKKSFYSFLN